MTPPSDLPALGELARTFEFLLNAMERAAREDTPADHGYAEKRRAVFEYVSALVALATGGAAGGQPQTAGGSTEKSFASLTNQQQEPELKGDSTMGTATIYTDGQLRYAATARCPCGAGLAYPQHVVDLHGAWDCSDILTGRAIPSGQPGAVTHTGKLPFAFHEITSESQSSANGASSRDNPLMRNRGRPSVQAADETT